RVPRAIRHLRDDADGRRGPRAHPQERGQRDHQADGGQQGHAHADGRRRAQGRARDHQRRRGPQRHAGRRGLMPVFEYTGLTEAASLADALGEHPKVFSALYVNMIRAGESSGALDVVLVRLADLTESQAQLRNKIIGAMLYPAIMVVVGIAIVGILFVVVIPKVTKIFEDMNVALPWTTRILIAVSSFARDYWYLVLAFLPALVFGVRRFVRTARGRAWWDRAQLRAPVFGELVRMLALSRFAKTLATLLASGVPLLTAMDIVKNIVSNTLLADVIEKARDSIREGESIAAPLKRSGQFPPLVYHMIAIG